MLQAGIHFFFFDESALIGLGETLANGGAEPGVFLQQAQCGLLHQSLLVSPGSAGKFSQLRFLFGGEMDFHRLQLTRNQPFRQRSTKSHFPHVRLPDMVIRHRLWLRVYEQSRL